MGFKRFSVGNVCKRLVMLNYLYLYRFEIYFEGNATYFISFLYAFEISLAIPSLTLEEAIDKSKLNWWNE